VFYEICDTIETYGFIIGPDSAMHIGGIVRCIEHRGGYVEHSDVMEMIRRGFLRRVNRDGSPNPMGDYLVPTPAAHKACAA